MIVCSFTKCFLNTKSRQSSPKLNDPAKSWTKTQEEWDSAPAWPITVWLWESPCTSHSLFPHLYAKRDHMTSKGYSGLKLSLLFSICWVLIVSKSQFHHFWMRVKTYDTGGSIKVRKCTSRPCLSHSAPMMRTGYLVRVDCFVHDKQLRKRLESKRNHTKK